ncbi:NADH-quinone oxidoreductase subunit H [Thermosulfidibacter takaii ABI70S6]|uniref:NADH-quinone oxidoreductase subunit H n=1 Tax=Thermosulfidibacter takaii (strain DSM 17441 / JCM 13301 / NBRC 103674 / ABI70S6) TaxID=1298851 RepID=A0A0S3QVC9_THET7|nr:NADH-quinone oxidoreductase subunit NuoH [Thermosulfidibacter takaii]BAT72294.1 NADH-quinone oxidoreductase subunit H [Thermosulfidibacter takaii ABI70S6]
MWHDIGLALLRIIVIFAVALLFVAYLTYLERKIIGHMQVRMGPMRVGPHGLLQPIADGLKLFFKEDIVPTEAYRLTFYFAPLLCLICALVLFAVVPVDKSFMISRLNIGLLYILSIASVGVMGIILAGWASGSKYSLLGGLRSAAQMFSYEIFLGFSLIGPLMIAGSLDLVKIVESQKIPLIVYQPVAFVIYLIAALGEINRVPFDLPEAESELVAGFHTEYSGMKFAYFFLAEYANMLIVSAIATIVFLAGWKGPILPGWLWFLIKMSIFVYFFIWVRATFPRYRYDQFMRIGWKIMLPIVLANILVTGIVMMLV